MGMLGNKTHLFPLQNTMQDGQKVCRSLARPSLRFSKHISAVQDQGDDFRLDECRDLVLLAGDGLQQARLEAKVREIWAWVLCRRTRAGGSLSDSGRLVVVVELPLHDGEVMKCVSGLNG